MTLREYIANVNKRYRSALGSEHSYRSDLENLIRALQPALDITNEPVHITNCGNPDYVITKGKIPIGYIEAKNIDKDLNNKIFAEQFGRYLKALDNLIITNYIWFKFYRHGQLSAEIHIAELEDGNVKPLEQNFAEFENLLNNFCAYIGQTIKSSKRLAELMASKARLLQNILERALNSDEASLENTSLKEQYESFKKILIHDLDAKQFADIYAQTLAYGMFAARLHDTTPDDFSRQEAAELIPKTNPFLRKLFQYVAGYDIDERIKPTVDNLAEVLRATNVRELLKDFGKATQMQDPVIHFYETFLAEYDPRLRKSRGVFYTPAPVVNFIVRAVDDILKSEFGLKQGLADTSKTKIKCAVPGSSKTHEMEVHKVQILDPATGTGTFLAEVVKQIYHNHFSKMQGAWSAYVKKDLIPRLNGFELLMASYTIAHLKLDMLLAETGYKHRGDKRFNIYLTNSLEEAHPDTGTLWAQWLSAEANEANHIKRDTPVMVILGNPPYSGISANNGEWISTLVDEYKYIDGEYFNERKHWLNDDYVKFIRYGQYFVEKNGSGILAFINPHGFLDNPTFRGMRWNLLRVFDKIYTIDLHGNSKKKEVAPDGSKDENVFDIMQGVSINIFVKTSRKRINELGNVFHLDCYGNRDKKYEFLFSHSLNELKFKTIKKTLPYLFFVPKNEMQKENFSFGFSINDAFTLQSMGITSARDAFVIDFESDKLSRRIMDFADKSLSHMDFQNKYNLAENYQWKIDEQRTLIPPFNISFIKKICYRPFDNRLIYYQDNVVFRSRKNVMNNLTIGDNFALNLVKIGRDENAHNYLITNSITDKSIISSLDNANTFPLYLYSEPNQQLTLGQSAHRTPNLNMEIVEKIAAALKLRFTVEKEKSAGTFAPIDILDYIYAVLHSPHYREKYKEFLKIDFPRVPYLKNAKTFWKLVALGGELRQIHLLESPLVEKFNTSYSEEGANEVTKITYDKKRVYINDIQYFAGVPETAWTFYIGGYQPAQKWLKDRKRRTLNYEDIRHYQKIIAALLATDRLMKAIDKIEIE